MMGTPSPATISTKQQRIATLAKQMTGTALTSLSHHIDEAWLREAYRLTRKDGASGVDGRSAEQYAQDLTGNLKDLLNRAKSGLYHAPAVRRVHIPKGDGKQTRPLGIPTFEDKVLQRAIAMTLEPIYEQDRLVLRKGGRRSTGSRRDSETHEAVRTHATPGEDPVGRYAPSLAPIARRRQRARASPQLRPSGIHPSLGAIAPWWMGDQASHGQRPVQPSTAQASSMVPRGEALADCGAARTTCTQAARSLRVLWDHQQWRCLGAPAYLRRGDLAEVARPPKPEETDAMVTLPATARKVPVAAASCRPQRIRRVANRVPEEPGALVAHARIRGGSGWRSHGKPD